MEQNSNLEKNLESKFYNTLKTYVYDNFHKEFKLNKNILDYRLMELPKYIDRCNDDSDIKKQLILLQNELNHLSRLIEKKYNEINSNYNSTKEVSIAMFQNYINSKSGEDIENFIKKIIKNNNPSLINLHKNALENLHKNRRVAE